MKDIKEIKVLDKGWVKLIDVMGSDLRICQAARVSTGATADKGPIQNQKLINYLYKNGHTSPFEQVALSFHVKCPIFVARQWFRHRTQSYNETSARYKPFEWECYQPEEWRLQDTKNIQGSTHYVHSEPERYNRIMNDAYKSSKHFYELALEENVVREQARTVMPVGQYTEFFSTLNLKNLLDFLMKRMHPHAQYEIRVYANALNEILHQIEDIKFSINIFDIMREIQYNLSEAVNISTEKTEELLSAFISARKEN